MKTFSDFLKEDISNLPGTSANYKKWLIYYSAHISKKDKNGDKRTDRLDDEGITQKYLTDRVKKAIAVIEKEHLDKNPLGHEYFVTYLRGDKRCGFLMMVDKNPPTVIREQIPNNRKAEWTALISTVYPCFPKQTNRPKPLNKGETVIKLSETMYTCANHEEIPHDIVSYMIEVSDMEKIDESMTTFTLQGTQRDVIMIAENNIVDEQRVDNGFYVLDLDSSVIY